MFKKTLIIIIILTIVPKVVLADVIYLRNGKAIKGKEITKDNNKVYIKIRTKHRRGKRSYEENEFRIEDILAIKRGGEKLVPITVKTKKDTLSYNNIVRENKKEKTNRTKTIFSFIGMAFGLGVVIWSFAQ